MSVAPNAMKVSKIKMPKPDPILRPTVSRNAMRKVNGYSLIVLKKNAGGERER
jgi:hypothetical protein